MLSDAFYFTETISVVQSTVDEWHIRCRVRLNPDHHVFSGHFPNNPVVPGVCQIQIIKEILDQSMNRRFKLTESDNVKFLAMISPLENPLVDIELLARRTHEHQLSVNASITSESKVYIKFKGKFESEQ